MLKKDHSLAKDWAQDPREHFKTLYESYSGLLMRFVYRFTSNREQAEEILHEVFSELLSALPQMTQEDDLKAWLFSVAKNKSINFEKRKSRQIVSDEITSAAVGSSDIEYEVSESQLHGQLQVYQSRLPNDLAQTWSLRRQGLSYQEISENLGIPLGTVKSRFSRLVEHFKKEFKVEDKI